MTQAKTISKKSNPFPENLEYQALREEGIKHISQLSGKVWTDHNLHDPGITILELLCYALTDLTYRTHHKIEDLLTTETNDKQEDNFYTAAQILGCNPLTILDYRKMLIDIDGVRNAWLEVAEKNEKDIFINEAGDSLQFGPETNRKLVLNGLYNVYLELENVRPYEEISNNGSGEEQTSISRILSEVENRLQQHRNLCEDFVSINILQDEPIAIESNIELISDADPEKTLLKIYNIIREFLSPTLRYYTLEELLKMGKTSDEIFEGRPLIFSGSSQDTPQIDSHGFIDTDDLDKLDLKTEIHVSDLYNQLMNLSEIHAIKSLSLKNLLQGDEISNGEPWCLKLTPNHRPVFEPEKSSIQFSKGVIPLGVNETAVKQQYKEHLSNYLKAKLTNQQLDLPIPEGEYRDLNDYYSIQHELPLTYGVGKGEIPDSATDLRKAQSMQLKGYLMFFDQLLVNYLGQLSHIRDLFSMRPDQKRTIEEKRTYFTETLDDVPDIEKLIPFFKKFSTENNPFSTGSSTLAFHPHSYENPEERSDVIRQIISAFENQQVRINVEKTGDQKCNKFTFAIYNGTDKVLLKSAKKFEDENQAKTEGEALRFLGLHFQSYRKIFKSDENKYSFDFVYDPIAYKVFLDNIAENNPTYFNRRNRFLDHLLGRFSEHFTEYVLLMYALNGKKNDPAIIIEDKADFLSHYVDISMNRGRSFNYTDSLRTWNTNNICGLEKKVKKLLGVPDWKRQYLNNIEDPSMANVELGNFAKTYFFQAYFNDMPVLKSHSGYPSENMALISYKKFIELIRNDKCEVVVIDCPTDSVYGFKFLKKSTKEIIAFHTDTYSDPQFRDNKLNYLVDLLKREDLNYESIPGRTQCTPYDEGGFRLAKREFHYARHTNDYSTPGERDNNLEKAFNISKLDASIYSSLFLEADNTIEIEKKYYFLLKDLDGAELWRGTKGFDTQAKAEEEFRQFYLDIVKTATEDKNYSIRKSESGEDFLLELKGEESNVIALSPKTYKSANKAKTASKERRTHALLYPVYKTGCGGFRFHLRDPNKLKGPVWKSINEYGTDKDAMDAFLEFLPLLSHKKNYIPTEENEEYSFELGEVLLESWCMDPGSSIDENLRHFLQTVKDDKAFYTFTDYTKNCRYGFRIVDEEYRVACHTNFYVTTHERETAKDRFYKEAICNELKYSEMSFTVPGKDEGIFYPVITHEENGTEQTLWTGSKELPENHIEEDLKKHCVKLLSYSRDPAFYQIKKNSGSRYLELTDERGNIIAEGEIEPGYTRREAIEERVLISRLYPIELTKEGFNFQLYNTSEFISADKDTSVIEESSEEESISLPCHKIWKSARTFDSLEEAITAFREFFKLLKDKNNYMGLQVGSCGPYSLEIVNPGAVLAFHPQFYQRKTDLENAILRTKDCINAEGFHVVEHILLRPGLKSKSRCVLQLEVVIEDHPCNNILLTGTNSFKTKNEAENNTQVFVDQIKEALLSKRFFPEKLEEGSSSFKLGFKDNRNTTIAYSQTFQHEGQWKEIQDIKCFRIENSTIICSELFEKKEDNTFFDSVNLCIKDEFCGCPTIQGDPLFENYLPGADPFSFWITVAIPYWPPRFQNFDFRNFFESTLRRETPAHIGLRIVWAAPKDLRTFEDAYRSWLEAVSGVKGDAEETKKILWNKLFSMKNVYPNAILTGDDDYNNDVGIVLDQTSIV